MPMALSGIVVMHKVEKLRASRGRYSSHVPNTFQFTLSIVQTPPTLHQILTLTSRRRRQNRTPKRRSLCKTQRRHIPNLPPRHHPRRLPRPHISLPSLPHRILRPRSPRGSRTLGRHQRPRRLDHSIHLHLRTTPTNPIRRYNSRMYYTRRCET